MLSYGLPYVFVVKPGVILSLSAGFASTSSESEKCFRNESQVLRELNIRSCAQLRSFPQLIRKTTADETRPGRSSFSSFPPPKGFVCAKLLIWLCLCVIGL